MNWTGLGVRFPRERWPDWKKRPEFRKTGIYMLFGYAGDDDLPTLYIGQGDCAATESTRTSRTRISGVGA